MFQTSNILNRTPGRLSLLVGILVVACMSAYWAATRAPGPCGGMGDCVRYLQMVESFRSGRFTDIDSPFNDRILGPWLVSLLPTSGVDGFLIVNALAALVFVVAWHQLCLALNLRNAEFAALLALFILHPLGFGFYHLTPASVDPLAHAFLALTTLAYLSRHPLLPVVLMLGLLTKESFTFIGLIMIVAEIARMGLTRSERMAPSLRIIGSVVAVLLMHKLLVPLIDRHLFPPVDGFKPSTRDALRYFWEAAKQDPARFTVWATACLCAIGAFPMLLVRRWRTPVSGLSASASIYFVAGGAGFMALGLVGGSDMSRIVFTGNFLILCAMLYPMGQALPSVWRTVQATLLSLVLALNYTRLLPTTLEYDYYMNDHRLGPTITVLVGGLAVLFLGIAVSWRMLDRRPA